MIIFFTNRSNDIDHMVPIGYKLAKESTRKIVFLSINPLYDISTDFRLNYINNDR